VTTLINFELDRVFAIGEDIVFEGTFGGVFGAITINKGYIPEMIEGMLCHAQ
jgi:hypothetical protein